MTGWRTIAALAGASLGAAAMAQNARPATPSPLIQGEIGEADRADGQGRRFDDYIVEFARGEAVVVNAAPTAGSRLEPVIEIYAGDAAQPVARDGADAGSRAARLSFTASEAGAYRIRILGGTAAAGRYVLRLGGAGGLGQGHSIARPPTPGQPEATPSTGPRQRFIICPGHPRCPR